VVFIILLIDIQDFLEVLILFFGGGMALDRFINAGKSLGVDQFMRFFVRLIRMLLEGVLGFF